MKEAIHSGQKIKAISKALVDTLRTKRVAPPKKVLIFSPACVLERVRKAKKRVAVPGVARRQRLPAARVKGHALRADKRPPPRGGVEKCCHASA